MLGHAGGACCRRRESGRRRFWQRTPVSNDQLMQSFFDDPQGRSFIMSNSKQILRALQTELVQELLEDFARCEPGLAQTALSSADSARDYTEREAWRSVYLLLSQRRDVLRETWRTKLESLFDRALETAYDSYRPAFSLSGLRDKLSLVEDNVVEGNMLIESLTGTLRNRASDELRDLNIRVARLFDSEEINERENPFRPYLLARALVDAAVGLGMQGKAITSFGRLAGDCINGMVERHYESINRSLTERGITADISLKVRKTGDTTGPSADDTYPEDVPDDGEEDMADTSAEIADADLPGEPSGGQRLSAGAAGSGPAPMDRQSRPPVSGAGVYRSLHAAEQTHLDQMLNFIRQHGGAGMLSESGLNGSGDDAGAGSPVAGYPQQGGPSAAHRAHSGESADDTRQSAAAAARRMVPGPAGQPMPDRRHAEPDVAGGDAGWLSGGVRMIGDGLRKVLRADKATYRGYAETPQSGQLRTVSPELTAMVNRLNHASRSLKVLLDDQGKPRNLILDNRQQLQGNASQVDEQIMLDVIAMMFEFIMRDQAVPENVRVELARLQFVVLNIAMRDPGVLTDRKHPVRVLLNRVASLAALQTADDEKLLISKISGMVDVLLATPEQVPEQFIPQLSRLLDEFDQYIADNLRTRNHHTEQVVSALETIPQRIQRQQRIVGQMRDALAGQSGLDSRLREFLMEVWVQVIDYADDLDAAIAQRFRKFVPSLIWSLQPCQTAQDRQVMSVLLTGLVMTLKEGLALIAWPEDQQKDLLDWLFVLHTRAMFPVGDMQDGAPPATFRTDAPVFANLVNDQDTAPAATSSHEQEVLSKALYETVQRRMDEQLQTVDERKVEQLLAQPDDVQPQPPQDVRPDELDDRLFSGVMINIRLGRQPLQARLSWINRSDGRLLLNVNDEHVPIMMSLTAFRRLFVSGRVSFLEDAPLVERALKSVMQSAEKLEHRAGGSTRMASH